MRHLFSLLIIAVLLSSCKDETITKVQVYENDFAEVLISGTITNRPENDTIKTLKLYISDLLADENFKIEKIAIDSAGNFKTALLINKPQTVSISHKAVDFNLILKPNASINVIFNDVYNAKNAVLSDAKLSGSLKDVNTQLFAFQAERKLNLRTYFKRLTDFEPEEFKVYHDSIFGADAKYIERFLTANTTDQSLKDWLFVEKNYMPADNLLAFPMYYEIYHPEAAKTVKYNDTFFEDLKTLPELKSKHLVNNTINSFGNYVRFHYYRKLNPDLKPITSKTLDSLAIREIKQDYRNNPVVTQLAVFDMIGSAFDNNNLDFLNNEAEFIKNLYHESVFTTTIERRQETVLSLLENPELPKNVELLDFTYADAVSFVKDLVKNANGKIVYIDNWAVWCAPCRSEFKEATPKLKKEFSEKVEFIYICHKSEEKLWKPMIAQYQLEGKHYFVTNEQSEMLSKYLSITGYPNYNIIDQNNEILHYGFEYRPSQPETRKILAKLTK